MNLDGLIGDYKDAFMWWYMNHYLNVLDPFGFWGKEKTERVIKTHIKLRGSSLVFEFLHFATNFKKYQIDYDCFPDFPYEEKMKNLLLGA